MHLYLLHVIVYTYMHVLAVGSCMLLKVALYNIIPNQERIPYSRKIWQGIKFGGLAVYITTAKLKSAKISYSHIYVWRSRNEPPNLNPATFF